MRALEGMLRERSRAHRTSYKSRKWADPPEVEVLGFEFAPKLRTMSVGYERMRGRWVQSKLTSDGYTCDFLEFPGSYDGEVIMFHGAPDDAVESILKNGFDCRYSNGGMFGRGVYFAPDFSKADLYSGETPHERNTGTLKVIVTSVILGRVLPALTRNIDESDHYFCSTVWGVPREGGGKVDHDEFMVRSGEQALPIAVIEYRHKKMCGCSRCIGD
eukprot:GDKH01028574.1.p2 GENE.GDKH01028574.1~~GDKH01028574.1.p2  ORF type:complete len:216 (+),score=21.58 GDKH01028574.1:147-794(+)